MLVASLQPEIIDICWNYNTGFYETDIVEFEQRINALGPENIVCLFSTTSCFAPRECDDIKGLAKLAAKYDIPHLVNNAYGLQSTEICRSIQNAASGADRRIDLFVQSTDKNLMVPVGGAIVCGFNTQTVEAVANRYAGRASSSQSLDVLMTLLSLGWSGYKDYLTKREENFRLLKERTLALCGKFRLPYIYTATRNPISVAISLDSKALRGIADDIGSKLFTRGVSGCRLVKTGVTLDLDGYTFEDWGCHLVQLDVTYLTAAIGLGCEKSELLVFLDKLDNILGSLIEVEVEAEEEED